jgi:prepilin-type N-terminal cleavage/methylation domain-containing protein
LYHWSLIKEERGVALKNLLSIPIGFARRRGYTLIEILVVSAISLLLMTVIAFIYTCSLRVYQESQGQALVFETAKLINRDLRNTLGYCVAVPGNWISPKTLKFPGNANATKANLDPWYLETVSSGDMPKSQWMANDQNYDVMFSQSQFRHVMTQPDGSKKSGLFRGWPSYDNMRQWGYAYYNFKVGAKNGNYGLRSYWMPAFFGRRDFSGTGKSTSGALTTVMESNDVRAGSWGWPRPDYRLDVDIDRKDQINAKPLADSVAKSPTIACWFYAENRVFNSPYTLALDNPNIVLVSFKFSHKQAVAGKVSGGVVKPGEPETTQLSMLRHSIGGFDLDNTGMLRADETTGNMLRAIKITPYYINPGSNELEEMTDTQLNSTQTSGAAVDPSGKSAEGFMVPRCFDVQYSLRNPYSSVRYDFVLRVYCQTNPQ